MKVDKQIKNDKYNIFEFIKYVSDLEQNKNIIAFFEEDYEKEKINSILQKNIEYHSMFTNVKFDIWLLKNKNKLKQSITYIKVDKLDSLSKMHIKKIRKNCKEIIIEFAPNVKIEEVKKYAENLNKDIIVGYLNYDSKELRRVFMLIGEKFEYKKTKQNLKILAIIHTFNEEDVIDQTIDYLIKQNIDIYILDNWSTDKTYDIVKEKQLQYPDRIIVKRYPEERPNENVYNWTEQLHKTEELSKKLDYDWFIHYDADEIRITPYTTNVTLKEMITFVDSQGYNAINTTVLDFRITDKDDNIFAQDTYFEIGRKPSHFMQIKTWKKCEDIDLATTGGHVATFRNQKIYPLKIINRHYPLRSIKQAEKKIYKDRLPRFEKEKKEKGWHVHYDKIAEIKDFIYEKENLNKFEKNTLEKLTLELISGIGIDKL